MSGELKAYVRIDFADQTWCVCEPGNVIDMTTGHIGFMTTEVQMTEAEFNALPEFQG